MSATAGSATVTAEGSTVYDGAGCTSFLVGVKKTSANGALVHVAGLHDAGEFLPMAPGAMIVFRGFDMNLKQVTIKGDGGAADVVFGIVAKTYTWKSAEAQAWLHG